MSVVLSRGNSGLEGLRLPLSSGSPHRKAHHGSWECGRKMVTGRRTLKEREDKSRDPAGQEEALISLCGLGLVIPPPPSLSLKAGASENDPS